VTFFGSGRDGGERSPLLPDPSNPGRRRMLVLAVAAVGLTAARSRIHAGAEQAAGTQIPPPAPPPHGAAPEVRLPVLTENGAKVPVGVSVDHPMEIAHHVTVLTVVNDRDPIPSKGEFVFSAANGQAYVAFQARLDDGPSTVRVAVECSQGRRWDGAGTTRVADGAGGCTGAPPKPASSAGEIRAPVIRLPRLLRGEHVRPGELLDVQVGIRHPVRTGLERRGGAWTQVAEPFYLTELEVFLDAERISRFALTPAVSDNPLITFRLRARADGLIRVVFHNSRGARLEAAQPMRLG